MGEVAALTVAVLKRTVPSAMPGIFFLSGETTLDEDNEETATLNLNAMNKLFPSLPWSLSFSYGKALQKTCIVTGMGKTENIVAAQTALCNRSKANSEACKGTYVAGSCASIGAKGNVEMQGGAYWTSLKLSPGWRLLPCIHMLLLPLRNVSYILVSFWSCDDVCREVFEVLA